MAPRLASRCTTGNKPCGGRCIPVNQNCDVALGAQRQINSNALGDLNNTTQAVTNVITSTLPKRSKK
jgi:hypothetical protein